jgi:hypothetical protein
MASYPTSHVVSFREPPRFLVRAWFDGFARRFPFTAFVGVIIVSNFAGSFFNFFYNTQLIVGSPEGPQSTRRVLDVRQAEVFWNQAAPLYDVVAYPLCFALLFYLVWPMMRCLRKLRRGESIDPAHLNYCRRWLVNFPLIQLFLNPIGWLPCAVFFPWMICTNAQLLMRREFTAIGETVNLCQRIEQLTKKCGGPILISDSTRLRLRRQWKLDYVGQQELPGSPEAMVVYKVGTE